MLHGLASTSGLAAAAAAASSLRRAGIFSDDSAECAPYQGPKQTKVCSFVKIGSEMRAVYALASKKYF